MDRSLRPSPPSRRAPRPGEAARPESYRSWIQSLVAATPILLTGRRRRGGFRASVFEHRRGRPIRLRGDRGRGRRAESARAGHPRATRAAARGVRRRGDARRRGFGAGALGRGVPIVLSTLLLNFVAIVMLKALLRGRCTKRASPAERAVARAGPARPCLHPRQAVGAAHRLLRSGRYGGAVVAAAAVYDLRVSPAATGENPIAAASRGSPSGASQQPRCASAGAGRARGGRADRRHPAVPAPAGHGVERLRIYRDRGGPPRRLSPMEPSLPPSSSAGWRTAFAGLETELHVPFLTLQATEGRS